MYLPPSWFMVQRLRQTSVWLVRDSATSYSSITRRTNTKGTSRLSPLAPCPTPESVDFAFSTWSRKRQSCANVSDKHQPLPRMVVWKKCVRSRQFHPKSEMSNAHHCSCASRVRAGPAPVLDPCTLIRSLSTGTGMGMSPGGAFTRCGAISGRCLR
jgi:hypothetical protein